ncbi:MAG: hypothetical protein ACFFC6_11340 [Promethearchaeota archaeon]
MDNKEYKRKSVYVLEEDHKKLRSKLALAGKSVSEWFRELTKKFLGEETKKRG